MFAKDDLHLVLKNIGASFDVFSQKDDIIGKRAKRMIPSGTIIAGNMIEDPPIIDKGDLVTIIIESEAFRITAQGKAQESGARSQIIRVVNTSSMKEISAQVVNEKIVRVIFAAQ